MTKFLKTIPTSRSPAFEKGYGYIMVQYHLYNLSFQSLGRIVHSAYDYSEFDFGAEAALEKISMGRKISK